ncbi:hypothetical protein [Laspinema olomoucense]|jgi:hypothetical protein|uniref:hypothetical protein n=1 Tax=Laspinema olomoucense TaxID=3231600 RepID=UPI0021BA5943|nr:hypothetical protein [Laspinema sp. D3d]MCT7970673.1 hypothetical protein [Laspinema sp. D3d]
MLTETQQPRKVSQPRTHEGKFGSPYREKRGAAIAMRLPVSLDALVRQQAEEKGVKANEIVAEILAKHFNWSQHNP